MRPSACSRSLNSTEFAAKTTVRSALALRKIFKSVLRRPSMAILRVSLAMLLCCSVMNARALTLSDFPVLNDMADRLVKDHGYSRANLDSLFNDVVIKDSIIKAIKRPAERLAWHKYRKLFVTDDGIAKGVKFIKEHQAIFDKVSAKYGVPEEVIAAFIGVETRYGKVLGSYRVLDSLTTLATQYPRRSKFFTSELEEFLVLVKEERLDPLGIKGSYAGAIGIGQFMPSSYRHYAVDFDDDQRRDLVGNRGDAIASVANYVARHRWQSGQPIAERVRLNRDVATSDSFATGRKPNTTAGALRQRGVTLDAAPSDAIEVGLLNLEGEQRRQYYAAYPNYFVIMRYNPSQMYAMAVFQLSEGIREAK